MPKRSPHHEFYRFSAANAWEMERSDSAAFRGLQWLVSECERDAKWRVAARMRTGRKTPTSLPASLSG